MNGIQSFVYEVPISPAHAATTGLTFVLMLLGIYTAAFGAGLTCGARWPFCDGWLGLFPATIPSFIEWFHRLVAMVTGFVIIGTAYAAWTRADDRRIAWIVTLAVLLLPLQIGLGAVTVTLSGLLSWGYTPSVQILHYTVALTILTLLTVGTALSLTPTNAESATRLSRRLLRRLTATVLILVPIQYLFSYGTLFVYSAEIQIVYYALTLAIYAVLVSIAVWTTEYEGISVAPSSSSTSSSSSSTGSVSSSFTRLRWLSTLGSGVLAVQMLLGRQLWGTVIPPLITDGLSIVLFVIALVTVWIVFRDGGSTPASAQTQRSD
ncbi:COX15/CtaA family protein [Halocatena marina]|uniref:COX15/CtaA family protein n=1 Tax=Halocatena marina TaxID=2934937 RepID=A0ABD5YYI9_9EURY